jgi:branched-chain amino acid transport system ATP-binding protein
VRIFGHATTDWQPYRIAALGVGYVPEGRRIFPNLSVEENLKVPMDRKVPWTIARIYELFPRLAQRKTNKGRQLSGGEQEMLAIARASFKSEAASARRAVARACSVDRAGSVSSCCSGAPAGHFGAARRAECARRGRNRRSRVVYSGDAAEFAKDEERVRALAGASAEHWEPETAAV